MYFLQPPQREEKRKEPERKKRLKSPSPEAKEQPKSLDELFEKTKATPSLYWKRAVVAAK